MAEYHVSYLWIGPHEGASYGSCVVKLDRMTAEGYAEMRAFLRKKEGARELAVLAWQRLEDALDDSPGTGDRAARVEVRVRR